MHTSPTPPLSVVVWANILEVNHYLSDIVNIALCLPDLAEMTHADRPGEVAIIGRQFGAALVSCGLDHTPQRTVWHIEGPVACTGTILAFGDSSISQLRSTLWSTGDDPGGALSHMRFLRELAARIESAQQHARTGHPALQHS
jgi:hypothetical protein